MTTIYSHDGLKSRSSTHVKQWSIWMIVLCLLTIFSLNLSLQAKPIQPQEKVTGMVTDNEGQPLIGVQILVKGTSLGTLTDEKGNYSLEVPEGRNV